jgi:hypothetical protein
MASNTKDSTAKLIAKLPDAVKANVELLDDCALQLVCAPPKHFGVGLGVSLALSVLTLGLAAFSVVCAFTDPNTSLEIGLGLGGFLLSCSFLPVHGLKRVLTKGLERAIATLTPEDLELTTEMWGRRKTE